MAQKGQISETEAVLDDRWHAKLKGPLSGVEIGKKRLGWRSGKSAGKTTPAAKADDGGLFLSFMRTFLFLLLVNRLRENSLHLLHWLQNKKPVKVRHFLLAGGTKMLLEKCPLTFVFLWFALSRNRFLFQSLSLAVLSPSAELEIDKLPHHKGLGEADGCKDGYPSRQEEKDEVNLECTSRAAISQGLQKICSSSSRGSPSSAHTDFGQWLEKHALSVPFWTNWPKPEFISSSAWILSVEVVNICATWTTLPKKKTVLILVRFQEKTFWPL